MGLKRDRVVALSNSRGASKQRKSIFNPATKTTISELAACEARRRELLRQRIYALEPDSMRRDGAPIYLPKFLEATP
jgi:hypothetical protein